jgi:hypothetical protein
MADPRGISTRAVTLHIGVQKTASTALHHFLRRNADALAEQMVVRMPVQGTPAQRMGRAAVDLSLDPTPEREAHLVRQIEALRNEIEPGDLPVLVSHENLPGAMLGNPGVTTLYPMLERLLALYDRHLAPFAPRFALYTREIGAWKRSVHNQAVKTDGYAGTWEDFAAETTDCGDWTSLADRMRAAIGADRAAVFALEDEPDPARPGQQLLRFAGLTQAQITALSPLTWRSNQSLNPGALEFMRRVNAADLGPQPRRKVMQIVIDNPGLFAPDAPGPDTGA